MPFLLPFLTYGGLASCSLGALLALVGVAKGRQARQLGAAVQVDSLAGAVQIGASAVLTVVNMLLMRAIGSSNPPQRHGVTEPAPLPARPPPRPHPQI